MSSFSESKINRQADGKFGPTITSEPDISLSDDEQLAADLAVHANNMSKDLASKRAQIKRMRDRFADGQTIEHVEREEYDLSCRHQDAKDSARVLRAAHYVPQAASFGVRGDTMLDRAWDADGNYLGSVAGLSGHRVFMARTVDADTRFQVSAARAVARRELGDDRAH